MPVTATAQAAALLILSEPALAAWGVPCGSPLHADALTYLRIKALGAPFLVLLLIAQVISRWAEGQTSFRMAVSRFSASSISLRSDCSE